MSDVSDQAITGCVEEPLIPCSIYLTIPVSSQSPSWIPASWTCPDPPSLPARCCSRGTVPVLVDVDFILIFLKDLKESETDLKSTVNNYRKMFLSKNNMFLK